MTRRGLLRSAVAGLLGCAAPLGLLAGPTGVLPGGADSTSTAFGGTIVVLERRGRVVGFEWAR